MAHHLGRATFIGEETGGAYHGNNSGEMPLLTLPSSKMQIRVPLFEYWNAVPGHDDIGGENRTLLESLYSIGRD